MKIEVDFDMSGVVSWVNAMNGIGDKAKASALNKVAEQGRTMMVREIAAEFAVPASFVRDRLRVRRASAHARRFVMEATLAGTDAKRAANMIHFVEKFVTLSQHRKRIAAGEGARGRPLELRFKIKRLGPKKIVKGAFIGNKGRTVFIREGSGRLPIQALQTIGVPQMFNTKRINAKVVDFMRAKLPSVLEHEMAYYMSRGA